VKLSLLIEVPETELVWSATMSPGGVVERAAYLVAEANRSPEPWIEVSLLV
jgi:hypothetical protein